MSTSRRDFVLQSTAAALAALPTILRAQRAPRTQLPIRVGVIGTGGRGSGAAVDALKSGEDVKIVALADLFPDRLQSGYEAIKKDRPEVDIPADRQFSGWDAYLKLLELPDVNYVIIAGPPGFRPLHLKAAIDAGKHVFAEKPIAVDAPGVRSAIATGELARQKGLAIGVGTQKRHQQSYVETIKRILDGGIGDILAAYAYFNMGSLWHKPRQPEWSDMEWQIRNWLYFTWLSGDHLVEQWVHSIDTINWVLGTHPLRVAAMGGRQARTGPEFGHIYDHFALEYEYPNGVIVSGQARQIANCDNRVNEFVLGTKGRSNCTSRIQRHDGKKSWLYGGESSVNKSPDPRVNPYVREHTALIASIRAGRPVNETQAIAESTLTAIMGRMAAYSGRVVEWDAAFNSQENLMPATLEFGPIATPDVAVPGKFKLT
jgi:predicted dehydrogenase